ncbi:hypothetical protein GA0070616_0595 [Micromonospora nigra]|uniref:Transposase IS116/IS110/IS902 family protein n=1 Tax=Micromonospora nigra TaxID=145857 RepID=A0A1C6RCZ7_9ACTN|nr:hypothetical protein GA0070616_0595 [Micromonospora nigra]
MNAIVVSSRTRSYRCAMARKAVWSGAPRCATIAASRGCRAIRAAKPSGPVCAVPTGACPTWTTTGTPASASSPHTGSSAGSVGAKPPTLDVHLEQAGAGPQRVGDVPASGSGKNVAEGRQPGVRRAKSSRALYTVALVRMGNDPRTRAYVTRRTTEGRTKREVMRNLKRYISRQLFRTLAAAHGRNHP